MQCQVDIGSPADSDQRQVRVWDRTDRTTESARDFTLVLDARWFLMQKGRIELERIAVEKDKFRRRRHSPDVIFSRRQTQAPTTGVLFLRVPGRMPGRV